MTNLKIVDDSVNFVERVMKEQMWSKYYTLAVIEEYKRFLLMASVVDVAPSFAIDQVWHTHLLYSRDYAEVCSKHFGKFIHHQPNLKTEVKTKGKDEYLTTKELYLKMFGYDPDPVIWSNWKNTHHCYIDINTHWVIPAGDWKALVRVFIHYIKFKINGIF